MCFIGFVVSFVLLINVPKMNKSFTERCFWRMNIMKRRWIIVYTPSKSFLQTKVQNSLFANMIKPIESILYFAISAPGTFWKTFLSLNILSQPLSIVSWWYAWVGVKVKSWIKAVALAFLRQWVGGSFFPPLSVVTECVISLGSEWLMWIH